MDDQRVQRIVRFLCRVRPGPAFLGAAALSACLASCGGDDHGRFIAFNVPNSIVVADFNGDGSPDLATAETVDIGNSANPGFASVTLQNHAQPGTFIRSTHYATGNNPAAIAAADLTGSGSIDLVVANFVSGNVSVFLQTGTNTGQFQTAITVATGGAPNDIAIGDLNGDGKPDLVVADSSVSGNVIIALQDPANPGHFLAPTSLSVVNPAASVAVGDLNGDGKLDIVVATSDVNGNNGRVSIFLQNPAAAGTFLTRIDLAAGAQPSSVKIADVNGDGLPDIIVADLGPGTDGTGSSGVTILLQDPAHHGTFLAPVTYATQPGSINVAVGDLDGDGKPDLVLANLGPGPTGSISVLLQSPSQPGVFLPAVNYAGLGQPLAVAIGDLNGDGHPDIALADGAGANVMFQSTTAPGTFARPVQVGN